MKNIPLLFLPGEGAGFNILNEVKKIAYLISDHSNLSFDIKEEVFGGPAYDRYGSTCPQKVIDLARKSQAIFIGNINKKDYDFLEPELSPHAASHKLRKELNIKYQLIKSKTYNPTVGLSPFKEHIAKNIDIIIFRDQSFGIYKDNSRGMIIHDNGVMEGFNTMSFSSKDIERVFRSAFEEAKKLNIKKIHTVDYGNTLESQHVWRYTAIKVSKEFPEIEFEAMYIEQFIRKLSNSPEDFEFIVVQNLLGEMIRDFCATATGTPYFTVSINSTGDHNAPTIYYDHYGYNNAPNVDSKNACPIGVILAFAEMLRYSLGEDSLATAVENAVEATLKAGFRTEEIKQDGCTTISLSQMGDEITKRLVEYVDF